MDYSKMVPSRELGKEMERPVMDKPNSFEKKIVQHLRFQLRNNKIKWNNIQEWSSSEEIVRKNARPDETVHRLSALGVWVAIKV